MIASLQKGRTDAATWWFYLLTGLCILVTCVLAGLGMQVMDQLQGKLTEPQVALGWAVLLIVVLQSGIGTMLVMIFYDPRRKAA